MRNILIVLVFSISVSISHAQSFQPQFNLCGFWYSYEYSCPSGMAIPETFYISQYGTEVICTKINGDHCVYGGTVSWQGDYTSNEFIIFLHVGSPSAPNNGIVPTLLKVIDNDHIFIVGSQSNVYRFSCDEVDSMNYSFDYYNINCNCHSSPGNISLTPNPFINYVNIYNNSGEDIKRIGFFNTIGQKVFESAEIKEVFDLSILTTGIYLYQIETISGKIYDGKLIRN